MGKQDAAPWGCTAIGKVGSLSLPKMFSLVLHAMERRGALLTPSEFVVDAILGQPSVRLRFVRADIPSSCPTAAASRCFRRGSRGAKEGLLPCQPEGGKSWQQARSCSVRGDGISSMRSSFLREEFFAVCGKWV